LIIQNDEDGKVELVKTKDTEVLIDVRENNNIVGNYITFINSGANTMSLDHEYTSEAVIKLTDAVDAMADEVGYNVRVGIAKAKQLADEITVNALATTHADKIRSAADVLSTALQNMQQAKFPELSNEAANVKSTAAAINPQTLTLDQRDAVKSFFRKAADLLNKMN
jgi:uncharacterized glyoxalase superfamily protein PhnB